MPHHIDRADRFLYLPLVGLTVSLALGLRPLCEKGVRYLLPERPGGCCAQKVPDTFLTSRCGRWAAIVGAVLPQLRRVYSYWSFSAPTRSRRGKTVCPFGTTRSNVDPNNIFAHRSFATVI